MEVTEVKCSEKGCTYVARHAKNAVANRILGIHKRHQHGILGRLAKERVVKGTPSQCTETGCTYEVKHDNPIVVKRLMARHLSVSHGIRSENAIKNDKYKHTKQFKKQIGANGAHLVTAVSVRSEMPPVINGYGDRNGYRNGHAHANDNQFQPMHSNGGPDPEDGFDYKAMLVELLERFPCCPSCGTNVGEYQTMLLAKIRHDLAHK